MFKLVPLVAAVALLSLNGVASAVPATDDVGPAISVVEGQDQGTKPAKKPVQKPKKTVKQKKSRQQGKGSAPAPASSATQESK